MTTRERWIVYPLLLLVVSISLKNNLQPPQKTLQLENLSVDQLKAGRIVTTSIQGGGANFQEVAGALIQSRRLQVVDPQGNPKIVLHVVPTAQNNQPNLEKTQGAITLISGENQEMLAFGGSTGGGFIAVRSIVNPQDFIAFGYQAGRTGMFWLDKDGKPQGLLKPQSATQPNKKNTNAGGQKTPEEDATSR